MSRWFTRLVVVVLLLAAGWLPLVAQTPATSAAPTLIIRRPDSPYTGPIDSFLQTEPFQVEVKSPGSGPTITVDFYSGQGVHQTLTLTETGPGTGNYLSQPITPKDGAQKTDAVGKRLPGNLSRALNGFGADDGDAVTVSFNGVSDSFHVYETNVTQAIGRHEQAFAQTKQRLADAKVTAQTMLKRPKLPPATIAKLNDVVAIADGKLKLLAQMDNILAHPAARQGVGDDVGTLYWKLRTEMTYWTLIRQPDPRAIDPATIRQAQETAFNIVDKIKRDSSTAIPFAFAYGIYNATMSVTMATPVMGIFGKNAYGGQATPEEIEAAATNLIAMVVMGKVVPAVLDSAAGVAADELSGRGTRTSTPVTPAMAGVPSGYQPRNLPMGFDANVNRAVVEQGISDITVRGARAIAAGVPAPEVNALVEESINKARTLAGGGELAAAMAELSETDLTLADKHFAATHPGARLITNVDQIAMIRSVRIKAALEASGRPQRWTQVEANTLQRLNSDASLRGAFEFEDAVDIGNRSLYTVDNFPVEPGYQPVLGPEDAANIAKVAAKGGLTIAENVPPVRKPATAAAPKMFGQPAEPAAPAPHETQVLQPGEMNTTNQPAGGALQPEFSLDKLKGEILEKRQTAAARAKLKNAAPVSGARAATGNAGEAGALKPLETDVVKPASIDALTPAEIARFTPEDIKGLPPEMRDRLPINQLSARQLQALADSGTVLTGERARSLTPDTIRRLPPELRDGLSLEALSRDQLHALADASGIATPASAWIPPVPAPVTKTSAPAASKPAPPVPPGGTFKPAGTRVDDFDYGSDADEWVSTKIKDLIQERHEDPDDYGPEQTAADGSVSRTSKDGKAKIVGRARNGRITLQRFVLETNTTGSAPAPTDPVPPPAPAPETPAAPVSTEELKRAVLKAGAVPSTVHPDSEAVVIGTMPDGTTVSASRTNNEEGMSVIKYKVTGGPPPPCKSSDADCDDLLQAAREKQAEADAAARALPQAQNDLTAADAADRSAAGNHDLASKTYATAAGFAALGQKDRAEAYKNEAREFDNKGNADSARAEQLRADAAAIKEAANTTALEAANAWRLSTECSKRPPCPEETNATPPSEKAGTGDTGKEATGGDGDDDSCSELDGGVCEDASTCAVGSNCLPLDRCATSPDECGEPGDTEGGFQIVITARAAVQGASPRSGGDDDASADVPSRGHLLLATRMLRWLRLTGPEAVSARRNQLPKDWLKPGTLLRVDATPAQAAAQRRPVVSLVANGASTGEAFSVQVVDPSGKIRKVAVPEGLVLEPVKTKSAEASRARAAQTGARQMLGAYCLEFAKLPPAPGMLYRVAGDKLQAKYKPLHSVLSAAKKLNASGGLHPDSDPKAYADSIKQYALWTKLENWDQKRFGDAFLERTHKNIVAMKQPWTPQMETAVKSAIPGRWQDITSVLNNAETIARTGR